MHELYIPGQLVVFAYSITFPRENRLLGSRNPVAFRYVCIQQYDDLSVLESIWYETQDGLIVQRLSQAKSVVAAGCAVAK